MPFSQILSRFGRGFAHARRQPDFSCGACERGASCGLPPTPDCVVMLDQIERRHGQGVMAHRGPLPGGTPP